MLFLTTTPPAPESSRKEARGRRSGTGYALFFAAAVVVCVCGATFGCRIFRSCFAYGAGAPVALEASRLAAVQLTLALFVLLSFFAGLCALLDYAAIFLISFVISFVQSYALCAGGGAQPVRAVLAVFAAAAALLLLSALTAAACRAGVLSAGRQLRCAFSRNSSASTHATADPPAHPVFLAFLLLLAAAAVGGLIYFSSAFAFL